MTPTDRAARAPRRRAGMRVRTWFAAAALLSSWAAGANPGAGEAERAAQRVALYDRLTGHGLMQIALVVPKGRTSLTRSNEGGWRLAGDSVCFDAGPLAEEIETRDVFELPDEARRQSIAGREFYRAIRHQPPRILPPRQETDFDADVGAALARFATAKLARKVFAEANQDGAGCIPDVVAVPAIRLQKRAGARTAQSAWSERMESGAITLLGMITINELRAARVQRLAASSRDGTGRVAAVAGQSLAGADATYGALRVDSGRFRPCYAAGDDPLPALVAWTLTGSEKVKRWMSATPETPKMIAAIDLLLGELRKPAAQRQCTVLVAAVPVLNRVKLQLEREKFAPALYPETATGRQVLAAYGFRNIEELQLARELGIESGEQFAPLRTAGIDTRDAYAKALERYMWSIGGRKPDAERLVGFVRDEREASARGISVKALRAERARREEDKTRKVTTALR